MLGHLRLTAKLLLTLVFVAGSPSFGADSTNYFDSGLALYKKGDYQQACLMLAKASVLEPKSAPVHYYLANCLVHMKQHKMAQNEYRLSYAIDPDAATAARCLEALHGYGFGAPSPAEIARLRLTASGAQDIDNYHALSKTGHLKNQAPSKQIREELTRADRISRQLDFEKEKHSLKAQSHADMESQIASDDMADIDIKAAAEIKELYQPLIYPGPRVNPLLNDPALLKKMEQDIRDQAAEAKERVKRQAKDRAGRYARWSDERHRALEQVAENMRTQMRPSGTTGGATLQSVGSDLYVRYYGVSSTTKQPIETHGSVVRIVPQGEPDPNPDEAQSQIHADSRVFKGTDEKDVDRRLVRGRLVN